MLWQGSSDQVQEPFVPDGYELRTYRNSDEDAVIKLLSSDGESMGQREWQRYRDILLPNGLFVVEDTTGGLVATAGAVHNPNPGRYYFPFGGELGYLIVLQSQRRRGLGKAVCQSVVRRMMSAGYESIRVCVQEHRIAAIRTYLSVGFVPFLHSAEVEQRWQRLREWLAKD
jgi:mycothiol synthase